MNVKKVRQEYITYGVPYSYGHFVTIEGIDCSGKTTLCNELREHFPDAVYLKGAPFAIASGDVPSHSLKTFYDHFKHLVNTAVFPALQEGKLIIMDRFIDSTIAYQGGGSGHDIAEVRDLMYGASEGLLPHLTLYLSILPDVSVKRLLVTESDKNRAGIAFIARVKRTYDKLKDSNRDRIVPVRTMHHKAKTVLSQSVSLIQDLLASKPAIVP